MLILFTKQKTCRTKRQRLKTIHSHIINFAPEVEIRTLLPFHNLKPVSKLGPYLHFVLHE